jgi:hypothetical protein
MKTITILAIIAIFAGAVTLATTGPTIVISTAQVADNATMAGNMTGGGNMTMGGNSTDATGSISGVEDPFS